MDWSWHIGRRLCIVHHNSRVMEKPTDGAIQRCHTFLILFIQTKNQPHCLIYIELRGTNAVFIIWTFEHMIKSCITFTQDPQPRTHNPPTHANVTTSWFYLMRPTCSKRIISLQWPESFIRKNALRVLTVREDTLKKTNKILLV